MGPGNKASLGRGKSGWLPGGGGIDWALASETGRGGTRQVKGLQGSGGCGGCRVEPRPSDSEPARVAVGPICLHGSLWNPLSLTPPAAWKVSARGLGTEPEKQRCPRPTCVGSPGCCLHPSPPRDCKRWVQVRGWGELASRAKAGPGAAGGREQTLGRPGTWRWGQRRALGVLRGDESREEVMGGGSRVAGAQGHRLLTASLSGDRT